jgi:hypothetical protein
MSITKFFHIAQRRAFTAFFIASLCLTITATVLAGGGEFTGRFDTALAINPEETDRVFFKHSSELERWKEVGDFGADAHYTSAQLIDPLTGKASLLALLVEAEDQDPVIFVDQNDDNKITAAEKFEMASPENPYLWETLITIPL